MDHLLVMPLTPFQIGQWAYHRHRGLPVPRICRTGGVLPVPISGSVPWLRTIMQASPLTRFVSFAQAILYRGAEFATLSLPRRRPDRRFVPCHGRHALPAGS
jgi:hypothetical protein